MNARCVMVLLLAACRVQARKRATASQLTCYKMESYTFRESYIKAVQKQQKKPCWPIWLEECASQTSRTVYKKAFRKVRSLRRSETPILQQDLNDRYQVIESPRYPNAYLQNLECEWKFVLPRNHLASIHFDLFNIEDSTNCTNDRVAVTSGSKARSVCGFRKRVQVKKMKNRRVKIIFKTDGSTAGSSKAPSHTDIGFKGFLLVTSRRQKSVLKPDRPGPTPSGRSHSQSGDFLVVRDLPGHDYLFSMLTAQDTDNPHVQERMSWSVPIDWSLLEQRLNQTAEGTQGTARGDIHSEAQPTRSASTSPSSTSSSAADV